LKNEDGVKEEIKKINKALGQDSKYECKEETYDTHGYSLKMK
jgi:hypothetical protein